MKKIFTAILTTMGIATVLPMQAQYFTVGPEVGYERAHHYVSDSHHHGVTTRPGDGIRIGAAAAYHFGYGLSLGSGLYYSHRGGAHLYGIDDSDRLPYVKDLFLKDTDYLTLPLTLGY